MPKYSKITRRLCQGWLYKYICRYNWGYYDEMAQEVKRCNSEKYVSRGCHWQKITMTDIQNHLEGGLNETVYYTTSSLSDTAFLCIDIDAHYGQMNAWDIAVWIVNNYFPQAYFEMSTRGLGVHLYILVSVSAMNSNGQRYPITRALFNRYIKDFSEKLKYVVDDEFLAEYEDTARVCGVYGTVTYRDKETDERCWGSLAKIPRPQTMEAVEQLISMPTYDLADLRVVVNEAKERNPKESKKCEYVAWGEIGDKNDRGTRKRKVRSKVKDLTEKLYHWNPNKRIFNVVCELTRLLTRKPSVNEVHQMYCSLGLNTGEDEDGRRIRRIEQAIDKVWDDYDADMNGKPYDISTYCKGEYLEILTDNLTDNDLRSTKYEWTITFDDLDLFMDIIMRGISDYNIGDENMFCSVGVEYVKGAFADARQEGILKSKANDQKVSAMRELCINAGLLNVDMTWVRSGRLYSEEGSVSVPFVGKNRGMRYYPTEFHPKYNEFLEIRQNHQEALLSRERCHLACHQMAQV